MRHCCLNCNARINCPHPLAMKNLKTLLLLLFIFLALVVGCRDPMEHAHCDDTVVKRILSPDRKLVIVIYNRTCKAFEASDGSTSTSSMLPSIAKKEPELSSLSALRKQGSSVARDCRTLFQNTSSFSD